MNTVPTKNNQTVYEGVRFRVEAVHLPGRSGTTIRRDRVVTPAAVVVLPVLDARHVVLIRNERFAVGQTLWELPAGTLEPDEDPIACASRELVEEAGYRAARVEPLVKFYPTPGVCTEQMHAFVAQDLEQVGQDLDENERITVEVVEFEKALQMIHENVICDAKTIATLLYHHQFHASSLGVTL